MEGTIHRYLPELNRPSRVLRGRRYRFRPTTVRDLYQRIEKPGNRP
jgi:hypothetical protein